MHCRRDHGPSRDIHERLHGMPAHVTSHRSTSQHPAGAVGSGSLPLQPRSLVTPRVGSADMRRGSCGTVRQSTRRAAVPASGPLLPVQRRGPLVHASRGVLCCSVPWLWALHLCHTPYRKYATIPQGSPLRRAGELADSMESFFLAETTKYLFLLLSNATAINDFFVFSTEGHLLPVLPDAPPTAVPELILEPERPPRGGRAATGAAAADSAGEGSQKSAGAHDGDGGARGGVEDECVGMCVEKTMDELVQEVRDGGLLGVPLCRCLSVPGAWLVVVMHGESEGEGEGVSERMHADKGHWVLAAVLAGALVRACVTSCVTSCTPSIAHIPRTAHVIPG